MASAATLAASNDRPTSARFRARLRKRGRHRQSEAPGGSGHECNFAVEAKDIKHRGQRGRLRNRHALIVEGSPVEFHKFRKFDRYSFIRLIVLRYATRPTCARRREWACAVAR